MVLSRVVFRNVAWLLFAAWLALIWTLSSMTPDQIREVAPFTFWDKACHYLAFCAGGALLALALRLTRLNATWRWVILVSISALILYGIIDEWHQAYTPKRNSSDPLDVLADALGAISGAFFLYFVYVRLARNRTAAP